MTSTSRRRLLVGAAGAVTAALPAVRAAAAPEDGDWIGFDRTDAGLVLAVTLNGTRTRAILDNGASSTLVDRALAVRAGLRPAGEAETVHGWSNSAEAELARPTRFGIGGFAATAAPLVLPLQPSGPPEPVLLGRDLFPDKVVEIDFARRRLRVSPRSGFRPPPGFIRVSRAEPGAAGPRRRLAYTIPLRVEGRPVEARLDLGSDAPLHLSEAFVRRWRMLQGRRVSAAMSGDVGGFRTTPLFTCAAVELGGVRLRGVPAEVYQESGEHAVVGLQLVSRFHVVLDPVREELWVRPEPARLADPFRKNRAGLACLREPAGLKVVFVAPGSPAERSGWRVGETIVAIDGAPPGRSAWRYGPPGEVHRLTLAGGGRRDLVLADYY